MKGRIVDVVWNVDRCVYLRQGVKQSQQHMYEGRYPGGCGTYVIGGEYESSVDLKIFVYDLNRCIYIDVKDLLLVTNGRQRISRALVQRFKEKNVGRKVEVNPLNMEEIDFDVRR